MGIGIKGITMPVLEISLDSDRAVSENLSEIEQKLSGDVLKGSVAVVNYKDMTLSDGEKRQFEDALARHNTRFLGYSPGSYLDRKKGRGSRKDGRRTLLVIDKTVRSGQRVEHEGDVLVIGDVNADSYIVALGNVIVMGTMRGIVHAGAGGDEGVTVIALSLKPQQLRIGSHISRAPDDQEDTPEFPERACVRDKQIYIERL